MDGAVDASKVPAPQVDSTQLGGGLASALTSGQLRDMGAGVDAAQIPAPPAPDAVAVGQAVGHELLKWTDGSPEDVFLIQVMFEGIAQETVRVATSKKFLFGHSTMAQTPMGHIISEIMQRLMQTLLTTIIPGTQKTMMDVLGDTLAQELSQPAVIQTFSDNIGDKIMS